MNNWHSLFVCYSHAFIYLFLNIKLLIAMDSPCDFAKEKWDRFSSKRLQFALVRFFCLLFRLLLQWFRDSVHLSLNHLNIQHAKNFQQLFFEYLRGFSTFFPSSAVFSLAQRCLKDISLFCENWFWATQHRSYLATINVFHFNRTDKLFSDCINSLNPNKNKIQ